MDFGHQRYDIGPSDLFSRPFRSSPQHLPVFKLVRVKSPRERTAMLGNSARSGLGIFGLNDDEDMRLTNENSSIVPFKRDEPLCIEGGVRVVRACDLGCRSKTAISRVSPKVTLHLMACSLSWFEAYPTVGAEHDSNEPKRYLL
jgi:hypothetical protein